MLELGKVGGNGALAHHQDFLQFGDGELLTLEQEEDAQPVGVGDDTQDFYDRGHSL